MQRVIVPASNFHSEQVSPGVTLKRFHPGGKEGPNGEVRFDTPGGQGWSEIFLVGDGNESFQMALPDIRLPANQLWPPHWHDCWTAVVIIEGRCLIGDWWMQSEDIFLAKPSVEYGPLVIGPDGCRLFEIFAKAHLAPGQYAAEYRDHPTLQGTHSALRERSDANKRNEGCQIVPCDEVPGMIKGRLSPGARWELGDVDDPERGVIQDMRLSPATRLPAHGYHDWQAMVILDGEVRMAGRTFARDDLLLVAPGSVVGEIEAGPAGAHLLQLSRTARGMQEHPAI